MRIAVLAGGGGTTLQNLIDCDYLTDIEIALVISADRECYAIERAMKARINTAVVPLSEIFPLCRELGIDLVCMGGFLKLLKIPEDFQGRVMNIHPSLIPAFCGKGFYGKQVHEAVLDYGCKITGATVHFADNEYDHGPIILQKAVHVKEGDTPETLKKRVFATECTIYPTAIKLFAENCLEIIGRKVRIHERNR